jgi:ribosomal protein S12 methylthiotransferase accessory factor
MTASPLLATADSYAAATAPRHTLGDKRVFPGTHRSVAPEETWARIEPMFPALGITRVGCVTGLDHLDVPVWIACRPNSRSLSTSQGKGLTDETAKVSAAMEALELHHAERPRLPLSLASVHEMEMAGEPLADLGGLAGTTGSRFHRSRPMLWAEAADIRSGAMAWLPFEVVHTSALLPAPTGSGCFSSTSNGLASGNTLEEATVHALCEVIERDAAAVWQAAPAHSRDSRRLDLDTVVEPDARSVLDHLAARRVQVTVHDVTSDVGVPTYLAEIRDHGGWVSSAFTGMGCHLDRGVALLRAVLEAAQSRLTYITGSRDDLTRRDYRLVQPRDAEPAAVGPGPRSFAEAPGPTGAVSFAEDIAVILARLGRVGITTAHRVDLTSPEFGVPVVRVVVPGLEGPDDDPTYLPGRRARRAGQPS